MCRNQRPGKGSSAAFRAVSVLATPQFVLQSRCLLSGRGFSTRPYFGARENLSTSARQKLTTSPEAADEEGCQEPGSDHAGSAAGGSIRIRGREIAREPVAVRAVKPLTARKRKQTGGRKNPPPPPPTG